LEHLALELLAQGLALLDLHSRKPVTESLRQREPSFATTGQRNPKHQRTVRMLLVADPEGIVGGLNRGPRLREELTTGMGQLNPECHPEQPLLSDLPLEFLHLTRQRRLSDEQPRSVHA